MNIYQHIDKNKETTWIVMIVFVVVVTAIAWFIGQIYGADGYALIPFAFFFSGLSGVFTYYNSDKMVLALSGAREVPQDSGKDLYNLVENVCIAAGLPKPKIYVIDDTAMNAFATGRDPKHSVICFTTGIVAGLEKRELEGVVAHELSHVGNYDILLMSVVSILVGTVALLSDWFTRGMFYGSRRRSNDGEAGGILLLVGIVLIVLSPIIGTLIKLAISRNREYLADSTAALITRYPQGLANALRKLARDHEILEAANGATAHLYIKSPLFGEVGGFFAKLFNTHPPIEERIRRLETM